MTDNFIVLVEDNPDDELLALRALKRANAACEVLVARDGEQAVQLLVDGFGLLAQKPQVILLDLKLPKLDGIQVLAKLKADERTRPLPVVILTSSKEYQDVLQCYRLGANSYLRKPVDYTEFLSLMQSISQYWLHFNVSLS